MTEHKESMVTMYSKKGMRHGNNWIHHEGTKVTKKIVTGLLNM